MRFELIIPKGHAVERFQFPVPGILKTFPGERQEYSSENLLVCALPGYATSALLN